MILKIIILALVCLFHAQAYTQENGILILNDDDLTNITTIFPHLFIKFYIPWCKHCKLLAPIYEQLAQELQAQNSTIRLAKINCQINEGGFQFGNVEHFPTLIFYDNGTPLNFDGDRTKSYLLKWLTKRMTSPVKEISPEELEKLRNSDDSQVSIVFHGELRSIKGATFMNVAYQDNYNSYYFIKEHTKPYGTVELLRSFANDVESPYPNDEFHSWIAEHDRPSVIPLDDRSISAIFRDNKLGALLFLQNKYINKGQEFKKAADEWKNKAVKTHFTFINVPEEHEDYYGLLEYMDVNPLETPLLIINTEMQKKYLLELGPEELTALKILSFLEDFEVGKVKQSPLESQHAHHHHDHDHQHDHHHHHDEHDHDHEHTHEDHHHHHHHHDHEHHHGSHGHHHDHHDHHHEDHDHDHHHHDHDGHDRSHHHHEQPEIAKQENKAAEVSSQL